MRVLVKILIVLVCAVFVALALTWLTVFHGAPGTVADGPWRTSLMTGSAKGGPYLRASIALHGLFALNRGETLYYTANTDSEGKDLDGNCIYHIVGREPAARWWSITAYGGDDFLIDNTANRYSVSKSSVARHDDGSINITAARHSNAKNWIALKGKFFSLTLRLYNPDPRVVADPRHADLPSINRAVCP